MCVLPYITVWFATLRGLATVAIGMNIAMRMVLAVKYRQPFVTSLILHPFGVLLTGLIGINSFFQVRQGHLQWKGRHIDMQVNGRGWVTQPLLKIGVLYLLLGAGGLWHVLGVFQGVMRVLASPIMFALAIWLFSECWRIYPQQERLKFGILSIGIIVVSFGIEWLGVQTGSVFGTYTYGETLRPSIGGVPISIGCAWFVMLIASTAVAQKIAPKSLIGNPFKLAFLVALLMVCFDLLMEPAAVKLDYWTWLNDHIPLQNYLAYGSD